MGRLTAGRGWQGRRLRPDDKGIQIQGQVQDKRPDTREREETLRVRAVDPISIVVMASQMYTYIKIYSSVYFEYVQYIVCQLYLNGTIFKTEKERL